MPRLALTPYELSLIRQGVNLLQARYEAGSLTYIDLSRLLDKVGRA